MAGDAGHPGNTSRLRHPQALRTAEVDAEVALVDAQQLAAFVWTLQRGHTRDDRKLRHRWSLSIHSVAALSVSHRPELGLPPRTDEHMATISDADRVIEYEADVRLDRSCELEAARPVLHHGVEGKCDREQPSTHRRLSRADSHIDKGLL